LQLFLARLATDPRTFEEYLRNPDEVMHKAGLSAPDRAALKTADPPAIAARLDAAGRRGSTPSGPSAAGDPSPTPGTTEEKPIITQPVTYAAPIFISASAGPGPVLPRDGDDLPPYGVIR
jgi:hypothetical protein